MTASRPSPKSPRHLFGLFPPTDGFPTATLSPFSSKAFSSHQRVPIRLSHQLRPSASGFPTAAKNAPSALGQRLPNRCPPQSRPLPLSSAFPNASPQSFPLLRPAPSQTPAPSFSHSCDQRLPERQPPVFPTPSTSAFPNASPSFSFDINPTAFQSRRLKSRLLLFLLVGPSRLGPDFKPAFVARDDDILAVLET